MIISGQDLVNEQPRRWFPGMVLLSSLLLANAGALAVAWTDRSWGALAIAIYLGPIMNGIVAAVSIASLLVLRRRSGFPLRAHLALSILGPAIWIVVDAAIIFNMGLHGC